MTWSMWSEPEAMELSTVVSEMGEQWSPNTEPPRIAASSASARWRVVSGSSSAVSARGNISCPRKMGTINAMVP